MSGTVDMKVQVYLTAERGSRAQIEALGLHYIGYNRNAGTENDNKYIGDVTIPVFVRERSIMVAQSIDLWLEGFNKQYGVKLIRTADRTDSGWYASEQEKERVRMAAASLVVDLAGSFGGMSVGSNMNVEEARPAVAGGGGAVQTNLNAAARAPIARGSVIQTGYFGAKREAALANAFRGMTMSGGARHSRSRKTRSRR
jgi:hypothetical protein